jgi:hypothetical protein
MRSGSTSTAELATGAVWGRAHRWVRDGCARDNGLFPTKNHTFLTETCPERRLHYFWFRKSDWADKALRSLT